MEIPFPTWPGHCVHCGAAIVDGGDICPNCDEKAFQADPESPPPLESLEPFEYESMTNDEEETETVR